MIKRIECNILSVTDGIICQQVNCKGVMGARLAKQIRDKYPDNYNTYRGMLGYYQDKHDALGQVVLHKEGNVTIANIFGQYDYGRNPFVVYTKYEALANGLRLVHREAEEQNKDVYIPYGLGCGLAHGDWNTVMGIIIDIFSKFKFKGNVYICKYNQEEKR